MSLQFLHINFSDAKAPQIRTAGIWNLAVAVERLRAELITAREDAAKVPSVLAQHVVDGLYRFTLRSGESITGRIETLSSPWFVIECADRKRAFIAFDAVEAMVEEQPSR